MNRIPEVELKKHIDFLNKKFSITCSNIFTAEEESILVRYGEWMSALEKGLISPMTTAQEHFIKVARNETPPETDYEKVWIKYKSRKKWEEKYGDTSGIPPIMIPRHWEGLTVPDRDRCFNTYQL